MKGSFVSRLVYHYLLISFSSFFTLFRKSDRLPCLNAEKVASIEKELESLLTKQAYFGLIDNIEWVLKMTSDASSSLEDLENFFNVMIRDNLYTERWLH